MKLTVLKAFAQPGDLVTWKRTGIVVDVGATYRGYFDHIAKGGHAVVFPLATKGSRAKKVPPREINCVQRWDGNHWVYLNTQQEDAHAQSG